MQIEEVPVQDAAPKALVWLRIAIFPLSLFIVGGVILKVAAAERLLPFSMFLLALEPTWDVYRSAMKRDIKGVLVYSTISIVWLAAAITVAGFAF